MWMVVTGFMRWFWSGIDLLVGEGDVDGIAFQDAVTSCGGLRNDCARREGLNRGCLGGGW